MFINFEFSASVKEEGECPSVEEEGSSVFLNLEFSVSVKEEEGECPSVKKKRAIQCPSILNSVCLSKKKRGNVRL